MKDIRVNCIGQIEGNKSITSCVFVSNRCRSALIRLSQTECHCHQNQIRKSKKLYNIRMHYSTVHSPQNRYYNSLLLTQVKYNREICDRARHKNVVWYRKRKFLLVPAASVCTDRHIQNTLCICILYTLNVPGPYKQYNGKRKTNQQTNARNEPK